MGASRKQENSVAGADRAGGTVARVIRKERNTPEFF
jgi:hypothetical protein